VSEDPTYGLSRRQHSLALLGTSTLFCLAVGYWIAIHWLHWGVQRGITISAVTQDVLVTVTDSEGASVRLPAGVSLGQQADPLEKPSRLSLPEHATIEIARAADGVVHLQLKGRSWTGKASLTSAEGTPISLGPGDALDVEKRAIQPNFVLPFRGTVRLGPEVRDTIEYILLSGTVTVVDKILWGERHVVLTAPLETGDRVQWSSQSPAGDPTSPAEQMASGFVSVGEGPALRVVAHAAAKKLTIERFGAQPYDIEPSAFDTGAKDSFLSDFLIPIIALTGGVLVLYDGILKIWGAFAWHKRHADVKDS
jgi:hypothetical protein